MRLSSIWIVALVAVVGACGSPGATAGLTPANWTVLTNKTGQFTLSAPADWGVQNCDSPGQGYVVAEHATNSGPACGRGENYALWLFGISMSGDQRQALPPNGSSYVYTAPIRATADAVAGGAHGYRYSARIDTDRGGFPPPKGTVQALYVFFTGQRTYAFWYEHWPTDPDRTTDFDQLVHQKLKFSA
jgi:hypothetical protein